MTYYLQDFNHVGQCVEEGKHRVAILTSDHRRNRINVLLKGKLIYVISLSFSVRKFLWVYPAGVSGFFKSTFMWNHF